MTKYYSFLPVFFSNVEKYNETVKKFICSTICKTIKLPPQPFYCQFKKVTYNVCVKQNYSSKTLLIL